jgi:hypothetical protein
MYFNVKEECIAKGCVSATCKFMNPGTMQHATMFQEKLLLKNKSGWKVTATIKTTINGKRIFKNMEQKQSTS